MGYVNVFQFSPKRQEIQRFADDRAQERHSLDPPEPVGQARVDGNETGIDVSIPFPIAHQQISLHRLASNVAQTRSDEGDPDPRICSGFRVDLAVEISTADPASKHLSIK